MERLGDEKLQFVLALIGGVALCGALLGAAQALLRGLARGPAARDPGGLPDLLGTGLLTLLWVLYQDARIPAFWARRCPGAASISRSIPSFCCIRRGSGRSRCS